MAAVYKKIPVLLLLLFVSITATNCRVISRLTNSGGMIFTVEISTDEPNKDEVASQAVKVLENKITAAGFDGEVAREAEKTDRIAVKIYGSHDWEKIKRFLFTTYRLELKKAVSPPNPSPLQTFKTRESAEQVATAKQEVLPFSKIYEDEPQSFVIVEKKAVVNGADIRSASAFSPTNSDFDFSINFTLNQEGAKKFGDWTARNISNYLAIVLDGEVQSAPFIRTQITDAGEITGKFSRAAAEEIALSLNSGYVPARLRVIEEKSFGN
jgi:preprotein translocase subunit SecD